MPNVWYLEIKTSSVLFSVELQELLCVEWWGDCCIWCISAIWDSQLFSQFTARVPWHWAFPICFEDRGSSAKVCTFWRCTCLLDSNILDRILETCCSFIAIFHRIQGNHQSYNKLGSCKTKIEILISLDTIRMWLSRSVQDKPAQCWD